MVHLKPTNVSPQFEPDETGYECLHWPSGVHREYKLVQKQHQKPGTIMTAEHKALTRPNPLNGFSWICPIKLKFNWKQ